jgi:hypothetical protein
MLIESVMRESRSCHETGQAGSVDAVVAGLSSSALDDVLPGFGSLLPRSPDVISSILP